MNSKESEKEKELLIRKLSEKEKELLIRKLIAKENGEEFDN